MGSPGRSRHGALAFLRAEHPGLVAETDQLQRLLDLLGPSGPPRVADGPGALARLAEVLADAGCEPSPLDGGSGLRFAMRGGSGTWPCLVQPAAGGALILYAIYPRPVPPARVGGAYDLIGRWNSRQLIGCIDLDPSSGRVVLRVPVLLDDGPPGTALLRRALDATLDAMDDAWPLLETLTAGEDDPVGG